MRTPKRARSTGKTCSWSGRMKENRNKISKSTKLKPLTKRYRNWFCAELRKENGDDYEPESLKVMQAAIERYLKSKSYPKSILRHTEFKNSRKVLEGKARKLRGQGKGKRTNRSKRLTKEEEEILWENGQLGGKSPRSRINPMWWLMTQQFGLRGRHEHHQMQLEDFLLERDDDGNEFLTFAEDLTKTKQGGLNVKQRLAMPKMFASGRWRKMPHQVIQVVPGEAANRNQNKRPVLPFRDR